MDKTGIYTSAMWSLVAHPHWRLMAQLALIPWTLWHTLIANESNTVSTSLRHQAPTLTM